MWEASSPLFLPWDCEQRCHAAFQCGLKQELLLHKRIKRQQAVASPSPCAGAEVLRQLWDAVLRDWDELNPSLHSLQVSRAKLRYHGLLYGWDSSHQFLPVAISYSWGWKKELGIAVTEMHKNLLHSQEASEEIRKLFPLNS